MGSSIGCGISFFLLCGFCDFGLFIYFFEFFFWEDGSLVFMRGM